MCSFLWDADSSWIQDFKTNSLTFWEIVICKELDEKIVNVLSCQYTKYEARGQEIIEIERN